MSNCKRFMKWDRRSMWGGEVYGANDMAVRATLRHILRLMSRGIIPDPDLIFDVLRGRKEVPDCGHIGCEMGDGHIH